MQIESDEGNLQTRLQRKSFLLFAKRLQRKAGEKGLKREDELFSKFIFN
jgi:hypothetical protein